MTRILTAGAIVAVVFYGTALANIPDLNESYVTMNPEADGASVLVVPDGTGARFDEARAPGGLVVDATITLTLLDSAGLPIFLYPFEDLWLETSAGGLAFCAGGTTADMSTDENGETIWLQPLFAGGCTEGESTLVMVSGAPLMQTLDLFYVSPDISGDLEIDLADIVMLTQALADFEPCADFNHDGEVNLVEIVIMVQAVGANCP